MFDDFETLRIAAGDLVINLRVAGDGPPVLLLHGYPQTHVCWHAVAPVLATDFRVVVPDLPGYGDSACPVPAADHAPHSKRAMAATLRAAMTALGHDAFAVVGHDRGARVGYRMALDHAEAVTRFVTLDVIPTLDVWDATDKKRAIGAFHWPFLAQPAPLPERMIGADPAYFAEWLMRSWAAPGFAFAAPAMAEYVRCFSKPEVIEATCEDYRAGATVDPALDLADRDAGRRLGCPVHFLWGGDRGFGGPQGGDDPLAVWRRWADEVTGGGVACGHFLPEEAPNTVIREVRAFLGAA